MESNFNKVMEWAIKRCEGMCIDYENTSFFQIYPFTTENISGYIDKFDLKNKSLLTVGSSGDQVINAVFKGCKDITLIDVNPYTKFYYYLKMASIIELNLNEFLNFLRYEDYPKVFKINYDVFDINLYNKLKSTLRILDYESYLFWDELLQTYNPVDVRTRLFSLDENKTNVISNCNHYLRTEQNYNEIKTKIKKVNPNFIIEDLFNIKTNKQYDNIWLSNIGTYLSFEEIKKLIDTVNNILKTGGNMLMCYLYQTTYDTKYNKEWSKIYDLENTLEILKEYNPKLYSFVGTKGILFDNSNIKDSVLIKK